MNREIEILEISMSGNEQFYTRECQQTLAISIQIIGIYIRLFSLERKKKKKEN